MDFFGSDWQIAALQEQLADLRGLSRLGPLTELAWYLRQRDTPRAMKYRAEALALLPQAGSDIEAGRLALTGYECAWLQGCADGGVAMLEEARKRLSSAQDLCGLADASFLEAMVLHESGGGASAVEQLFATAIQLACAAGDMQRSRLGRMRLLTLQLTNGQHRAQPPPREVLESLSGDDPGLRCMAASFVSHHHYLCDRLAESISIAETSLTDAAAAGLLRQAINTASATAADYCGLGDHAAGLEWMERALALSRQTGWPRTLGWSLALTASIMRDLGRHDAERELLAEAVQVLQPFAGSRSYFAACLSMGHAHLAANAPEAALSRLREAEELARNTGFPDILSECLNGQARALSMLGQAQEAARLAEIALEEASRHGTSQAQIGILQTLADICREHGLPAPPGSTFASAPIHHLERLIALSSDIGAAVPHAVYAALSRDYEAAGDLVRSLHFERETAKAIESEHLRRADDLAAAVQARQAKGKAEAEAKRQRELAQSRTDHAEALDAMHRTLQELADTGREITVNLDMNAVFQALLRHVGVLLDAPSMAVFIHEEDALVLRFGMEDGHPMPLFSVPLSHPLSQAVRCMRERRLLRLELPDHEFDHFSVVLGTQAMRSALFAPLLAGEQVLGVLSIRSPREHAYGERECRVLQTLAAYAGVALCNARRAQGLAEARAQIEREKARNLIVHAGKLSTVGRMVNSLIHELSHPVGAVTLSMGSVQTLLAVRETQPAREMVPAIQLEVRRLQALVHRLRNMARMESPTLEPVSLPAVLRDARALYARELASEAVAYAEDVQPLVVRADGVLLSLAIANVVTISRQTMAHTAARRIDVRAWGDAGRARVSITDSGPGLPDHVRQLLLGTSFNGRPEYQATGLGLALCAEYVAAMDGCIRCTNLPAGGAEVRIELPLA